MGPLSRKLGREPQNNCGTLFERALDTLFFTSNIKSHVSNKKKLYLKIVWQQKLHSTFKLDRVGHIDNISSTNKLHHFVKKKSTCDMSHMTHDIGMWHMNTTFEGGEHSLKISGL